MTRVLGRLRRGKAFVTLQYGDDRYVVREALFCHVLMKLALLTRFDSVRPCFELLRQLVNAHQKPFAS